MYDKWKVQLNKFLLPFLILKEVSFRPKYGYYIMNDIIRKTGLEMLDGTLYSILLRLKKSGLLTDDWVIKEDSAPRKYYQISAKGIAELKKMEKTISEYMTIIKTYEKID